MKGDLFKGIKQFEFPTPERARHLGKPSFVVPVYYYDNTSMTAIYTASTAQVRPYLPDPRMHPVELRPGRCLVAFTAFEYRKTDIDPYNEFSIAVLINFDTRAIPGLSILRQLLANVFHAYVWHLPVTTEIARYGGVELYGYPKFIADITFTRADGHIECALVENNQRILTLRGKQLPTRPGKVVRFKTYPVKDGITLCGNVYTNHLSYAESRGGSDASLTVGTEHPICAELRSINLSDKPLIYQYSAANEAVLFGPRNLIDN
jgi:hypothetical protein